MLHRLTAGGFRLRLKAGLIGHTADYTTLKSSSGAGGLLLLDVSLPYLVCHIATRCDPIASHLQVLTPVAFPKTRIFTEQLVPAFSFHVLHGPGHRHIRQDADQHIHMVPVDRSRIDYQFDALRDLTQQFTAALPYITTKNFIPLFRRPHQVILAIPHRVAAMLVVFHHYKPSTIRRLKARGVRIPHRGL
jgi:hypothetical protein